MEQWWFSSGEMSLYLWKGERSLKRSDDRRTCRLPQSQLSLGVDLIDVVVAWMVEVVADARYQQNEDVHVAQTRNQICLPSYCIHLEAGARK